jgi:hypothetical protein
MKNTTIEPTPLTPDTQLHPQDIEPVRHSPSGHPTWEEVEDATLVLNPDADSMESRG